ncbi:ATP-binding cassette domain-containing protein [Frankia sp. CNm7]|uniref:ATP-binding cassette domain-containing protein n=1 Tax=Frankia nepalensis TaxID=1836974 RepID=A0A937R6B7_9ACTN|nr:ATP-binding cassette domain-containing protein [Frankia nepalensis]MBL7502642.1 ATP-binding cassette domain-containing protein [Frankia nepalensis]MBL7514854.1 ATP-binding cassette domain-containing protein [Frankia nepalensis]MBL7520877.1 ATP-binding cassette domain-containing protein [Frankia nepalensis]MBL7626538.1 ATP-binding cassette domain-containing protein [Frankia nepalensis]
MNVSPVTPSLIAEGLCKRYGDVVALDGFDLAVPPGTVHGLLGPNGAGKSTAVKILTTLLDFDSGTARVAGHDVRGQARLVRRRIGLVGQEAAVDEILSGRQNLVMFGRLYGLGTADARSRADDLLASFDLAEAADRAVSTYSGGMRRRLDIAVGLVLTPSVLFLDEPTTGLDPRARNEVWQTVRQVAERGTTVLLTTQYLDEADQLASRITVLNQGRAVADDSPEALKRQIGGDRVTVTLPLRVPLGPTADALAAAVGVPGAVDPANHAVTFEAGAGVVVLAEVVRALDAAGVVPEDLVLRRPTLDEVFLTLTGPRQRAAAAPTTKEDAVR